MQIMQQLHSVRLQLHIGHNESKKCRTVPYDYIKPGLVKETCIVKEDGVNLVIHPPPPSYPLCPA